MACAGRAVDFVGIGQGVVRHRDVHGIRGLRVLWGLCNLGGCPATRCSLTSGFVCSTVMFHGAVCQMLFFLYAPLQVAEFACEFKGCSFNLSLQT